MRTVEVPLPGEVGKDDWSSSQRSLASYECGNLLPYLRAMLKSRK